MPKRKREDRDYHQLYRKLKKIEDELERSRKPRRRCSRILSSSSSTSSSYDSQSATIDGTSISPVPPVLDREPEPTIALSVETVQAAVSNVKDAANGAQVTVLPNTLGDAISIAQKTTPVTSTGETHPVPVLDVPEDLAPELDSDILEILGVDPTKTNTFGKDIQKDVSIRFEHTATTGLTKEERKELTDKYLIPGNCKLIGAPALNPEIKTALSEMAVKRDKVIESKQKIMASAISSLGDATTLLLSSKEKNTELLRLLIDTGRLLCDCQHNDTVTRRNFVIYSVKKEIKESLHNTKIDNFLFGGNLPDTLKTAKAINKSGEELKAAVAPKQSVIKRTFPSTSKKLEELQLEPQAASGLEYEGADNDISISSNEESPLELLQAVTESASRAAPPLVCVPPPPPSTIPSPPVNYAGCQSHNFINNGTLSLKIR